MAKVEANLAAVRLLRSLQAEDRPAQPGEQQILASWSGWGAVPKVFDESDGQFAAARAELQDLLSEQEWRAASRTTLNAHYTDAAYAQAMWDMVTAGGLPAGARVLEPGCGAGTFLGLAPADHDLNLVGVELDPTTAGIARYLYPDVDVRGESFADTRLPDASIDLVIGNVPFGKVALHDKTHNPSGHTLHNHFVIKSLHLTRPGGLVAVLTSHYTMDAANPAARREIAQLADLITAVRLPISAHQKAAGTQVITDLLVLRRRDPTNGASSQVADAGQWETTVRLGGDEQRDVFVNGYFAQHHPENVIGTTGIRSGQFGPELDVRADPALDVATELRARLESTAGGQLITSAPKENLRTEPSMPAPALDEQDHIERAPDGSFRIVDNGVLVEHPVPASQAKELIALLGLRDTTIALLAAEAASAEDTEQIAALRRDLNRRYDTYLARFGPINRISWRRTGRVDPVTGADRLARISPPQGRFRTDPHSPAVYALEDFDATTGTAAKAAIFTGRVVAPRTPRLGADTPADAVAICMDTHGEVRLDEIARLLGRSENEAREAIAGLVFADPADPQRLIHAPAYLSGNVRTKLAEAEAAAERDAATPEGGRRWDTNIAALREVLPPELTPAEIDARLGASWIEADVVQQFLRELLQTHKIDVEHPGGSTWTVRASTEARHSVLAAATYGTARLPAIDIAQSLLEQRLIRIYDELDDGRRVPNLTETVAAQDRARELNERFSEWIWADPERAATLARRYNDMFNSLVLRSYDGTHMQLPGLAITFTPREHQIAAVARIVSEPAVLLAHEVGAGKTAEMVIGAHELRRLGMANKPCVVVPNHMLEQFSREWLQLYPQARILAASIDDLSKDKRRHLIARIATGDWDAVILSRSAFERIPMSSAAQGAYLDEQTDELRRRLEVSRAGRGLTVKRLEGALARAEERVKKLTDSAKDPGITFEETGIDYLMVDEAHGYKNLATVSNIPGVTPSKPAQRASDLHMKLGYLRERHGGRVGTFATATPIANSVAECYTMQRYLRPDLLLAAGLIDFDTWAATFGEVTTNLELDPDGSRFRMQTRFAKFRNVPELLRMWHVSADIKTAEDLGLPTPELRGGKAETIVVPGNDELAEFMAELSERADQVRSRKVKPEQDNMLKVAGDGRKAALDLRLVARDPGEDSKLPTAANRIAARYHANRDRAYPDSVITGALQLVFCDLGTPSARARSSGDVAGDEPDWTAYAELKQLLVDRGLPVETIRFVHEARNDKEKGELFAAARNGRVSVLLGSTEKMGVGTNVQRRALALHHLECPWRPADIAQREGRILRQGNQNPEVEITRYVTEGSFDAYLWQTVERKARFIAQVIRGRLDVREIEDVGDTALSYAEVKALATGDPRILEKATLDAEVTRLERLERAYTRNQRSLSFTINAAEDKLPKLQAEHEQAAAAAARAIDISGDRFSMHVKGTRWTTRADAAIALRNALAAIGTPERMPAAAWDRPNHVANIAGFDVHATPRRFLEPHLSLTLAGVPRSETSVDFNELRSDRPLGIITRLQNRASDIDRTAAQIQAQIDALTAEADRARTQYAQPFPHHDALEAARHRCAELEAELAKTDTDQQQSQASASPAAAGSIGSHSTSRRAVPGAPAPAATPAVADRRLPHFRDRLRANVDTANLPADIRIEIDQYGADPTVVIHHDVGRAIVRLDATHRDHLDPRQVITMALAVARRESTDPRFTSESRAGSAQLADRLTQWLTPPPTAGGAGEATPQRTHRGAAAQDRRAPSPPQPPATVTDEDTSSADITAQQLIRAEVGDREIGPPIQAGAATQEATEAIRAHLGLSGLDPVDAERHTGRVSGWMVSHPQPYGREPRRLFYPDAPPQARPPTKPPSSDRLVAVAATSTTPRIRVKHTDSGTLVHGTERGDTEVRAALKQHGFKWSRSLEAWYLPRNYRFETRSVRVRALKRTLGDQISISNGDTEPQTPAAAELSPASSETLPQGQPIGMPADAASTRAGAEHGTANGDETPVADLGPRDGSLAELDRDTRQRFYPTGGRYGVWDMRDGRFLAVEEGRDGYPRGGSTAGPPFRVRAQVDAYVAALNAGTNSDEALRAAADADPTGFRRAERPFASLVVSNPPPGGWTAADRVPPPTARDTGDWPSVQAYPIGTELSVHAVGEDGPGRQFGHGKVVDHPGPGQVVVESPWGTRRTASLTHVKPLNPAPGAASEPLDGSPVGSVKDEPAARWAPIVERINPAVLADPHWPALASALERAAIAGYPVAERLPLLATGSVPDEYPARALHYRLIAVTEVAVAAGPAASDPVVGRTTAPATEAPGTTSRSQPGPTP